MDGIGRITEISNNAEIVLVGDIGYSAEMA